VFVQIRIVRRLRDAIKRIQHTYDPDVCVSQIPNYTLTQWACKRRVVSSSPCFRLSLRRYVSDESGGRAQPATPMPRPPSGPRVIGRIAGPRRVALALILEAAVARISGKRWANLDNAIRASILAISRLANTPTTGLFASAKAGQ
jgi:hypothetical protein